MGAPIPLLKGKERKLSNYDTHSLTVCGTSFAVMLFDCVCVCVCCKHITPYPNIMVTEMLTAHTRNMQLKSVLSPKKASKVRHVIPAPKQKR